MHKTCAIFIVLFGVSVASGSEQLLKSHCSACHADGASEGDFRLADLGAAPNEGSVEFWIHSLDRVRAKEMPPAEDSELSSAGRRRLIRFLEDRISAYDRVADRSYQTSPRRLNNRELANSLADVLLVDHVGTHEPLANLVGDTLEDGFDTNGDALGISEYHLEQYVNAFRKTLDAIILDGPKPKSKVYNVPTAKFIVTDLQNRARKESANRTKTSVEILDLRDRVVFENFPEVPVSGRYRMTIRAMGVDRNHYSSDRTGIYEGDPIQLRVHLGGVSRDYDLPDGKAADIEIDEWLAAGTAISLSYPTDGLRLQGNGNFKFQYRIAHDHIEENDPKLYAKVVRDEVPKSKRRKNQPSHWTHWTKYWQGPRPRIFHAKVEGPIYDSWPPQRQVALLGKRPNVRNAVSILKPIAERAWRRSVQDEELAPIVSFVKSQESTLGDVEALKEGVIAILVSPSFVLINPENETPNDLFATKLSYFLRSTVPTEELRAGVASGDYDSFRQVQQYVQASLKDGHADAFVEEFPYAWLQLDRINFMAPDPDQYSFYHRKSVSDDMIGEVQHFFRHAIDNNIPIPELLLADYSFVNADLAKVYEIKGVKKDSQFRKYTFKDGRRGGMLGMGAFLTLTADSLGTSPIHRAIYVMENFLGIHPAPPPADVEIKEPDVRSARTIKEVLEAHRSDRTCAACHQAIDPFGYAFENFDPAGAWRDQYESEDAGAASDRPNKKKKKGKKKASGIPIDASSSFLSGAEYTDVREFRRLMATEANRSRIVRCFVTKLLTYANGEEPEDSLAVERIVKVSAEHDYRIVDTIAAVIDSPLFREQ